MSKHELSDEDKALFQRVVKDVKPLGKTKKIRATKEPPKPRARRAPESTPLPQKTGLSNYIPEPVSSEATLVYSQADFPRRRLRELKSGSIAWQARLDLHGLPVDKAQTILWSFIQQQTQHQHRCVLIIHGKGGREGEAPVLKNHVASWLKQMPRVLAFHSALPREGGAGALYVLLKR